MQKPILIIGTGVLAREVADILLAGDALVYGFLAPEATPETELGDLPIVGHLGDRTAQGLLADERHDYVIALEDPATRAEVYKAVFGAVSKLPLTVVHPTATIAPSADLASGMLVLAHAMIGAACRLEHLSLIRTGAIIESGASLESYCSVGAGAIIGPEAQLGAHVQVGAGAIVHAGVQVEDEALLAPGAVVLRKVTAGSRMAGNPAQAISNA
jgi:sugar O-acyltransferase (sialic acid O-acetyltransferase NeuD family)